MSKYKKILEFIFNNIIAIIVTIIVLYPVGWMVTFSLRSNVAIFSMLPKFIPEEIVFDNYINIWSGSNIPRFFLNSLIVALSSVVITIIVSTPAAYSLSRLRFKGKTIFGFSILFTQLLPTIVLLLPLFLLFRAIKLYDTFYSLIISYTAIFTPFSVFLLLGFFNTLPKELEEAAYIDGASRLQAFIRVILPNTFQGLAVVSIFVFTGSWQEFLLALSFIFTESKRTLPTGLMYFFGQYRADYAGLMAASVVASVPSIILFVFLQRYLVRGYIGGAIKE